MDTDLDTLAFATRLVSELGESAIRLSHVHWVELTASDQPRAAAFWRDVLRSSERLLAQQGGHDAALTAIARADAVRVNRPIP